MPSTPVPTAAVALLTNYRCETQAFLASASLLSDVGAFVERVATSWELDHLGPVGDQVAVEFAVWLQNHEPSPAVRITVTWTAPLLQIEVVDQGLDIPHPGTSVHDAAMAVRLLVQPGVQWGASLDARGRCLWATVASGPYEDPSPTAVTEAGPS